MIQILTDHLVSVGCEEGSMMLKIGDRVRVLRGGVNKGRIGIIQTFYRDRAVVKFVQFGVNWTTRLKPENLEKVGG